MSKAAFVAREAHDAAMRHVTEAIEALMRLPESNNRYHAFCALANASWLVRQVEPVEAKERVE